MELQASDIITILITILGFFVNYHFMNKSFKEEIEKKKSDITLECLSKCPRTCLELIDLMLEQANQLISIKNIPQVESYLQQGNTLQQLLQQLQDQEQEQEQNQGQQQLLQILLHQQSLQKQVTDKIEEISKIIVVYGSINSIKILSEMKQYIFALYTKAEQSGDFKLFGYLTLLICQIKYDLTGIECSPEYWYKIKISDYEKDRCKYKETTNEIVKDLRLENFLKINQ